MDTIFQNKIVQALLVFLAGVGLLCLYQTFFGTHTTIPSTPMNESNMMETMQEESMMNDTSVMETDYTGTHIMPNGAVMLRNGTIVDGAVIQADGSVLMPDGTLLSTVRDMRAQ